MDKYDRLKLHCLRQIAQLEAFKRAIEAAHPEVRRRPVDRSHKTWLRQAIELRAQNRLH